MTINVKERNDGDFVYSFSAKLQKEWLSTRRTLHADVTQTAESGKSNTQPTNENYIHNSVKSQYEYQTRTTNLSNRELLSMAADNISEGGLTEGEKDALRIFILSAASDTILRE